MRKRVAILCLCFLGKLVKFYFKLWCNNGTTHSYINLKAQKRCRLRNFFFETGFSLGTLANVCPSSVPSDWVYRYPKFYKVFLADDNFADALVRCGNQTGGMRLAEWRTQAEYDSVSFIQKGTLLFLLNSLQFLSFPVHFLYSLLIMEQQGVLKFTT